MYYKESGRSTVSYRGLINCEGRSWHAPISGSGSGSKMFFPGDLKADGDPGQSPIRVYHVGEDVRIPGQQLVRRSWVRVDDIALVVEENGAKRDRVRGGGRARVRDELRDVGRERRRVIRLKNEVIGAILCLPICLVASGTVVGHGPPLHPVPASCSCSPSPSPQFFFASISFSPRRSSSSSSPPLHTSPSSSSAALDRYPAFTVRSPARHVAALAD